MVKVSIEDGLVLFQSRLSRADQQDLWARCRALADGPVPIYTPTVRGGRKMSVGMLCLGTSPATVIGFINGEKKSQWVDTKDPLSEGGIGVYMYSFVDSEALFDNFLAAEP